MRGSKSRMTSLFSRAVASLRSAAQSAAAQAAQPTHVPAAPVVWDKRNVEELKRSIPLSFSPPTSLSHTHVYPRGGSSRSDCAAPGVRGLVGAPGRARGGRLPNRATSAWLPKKVPSAGGLPYLVTCLLSKRLGLIYSYSSPVQRVQPTADPLCGASILAHGGSLRHARARIRE